MRKLSFIAVILFALTNNLHAQIVTLYYPPSNENRNSTNSKLTEGNTINGFKDGRWLVYYNCERGGTEFVKDVVNYSNRQLNGVWIEYKDRTQLAAPTKTSISDWQNQGQLLIKGNYLNNQKDGEWFLYRPTGELEEKQTYKNGKKDGEWFTYERYSLAPLTKQIYKDDVMVYNGRYANGQLVEVGTNLQQPNGEFNANGRPEGLWVTYYGENKEYINDRGYYSNGVKVGEWCYYQPGNKLLRKETYNNNGVLNGTQFLYYDGNGGLREQTDYLNGKKNGVHIEYDDTYTINTGKINLKEGYINDLLDGEYTQYYQNGRLEEKCNYKHGGKDADDIMYTEDGQISYKAQYANGVCTWHQNF